MQALERSEACFLLPDLKHAKMGIMPVDFLIYVIKQQKMRKLEDNYDSKLGTVLKIPLAMVLSLTSIPNCPKK